MSGPIPEGFDVPTSSRFRRGAVEGGQLGPHPSAGGNARTELSAMERMEQLLQSTAFWVSDAPEWDLLGQLEDHKRLAAYGSRDARYRIEDEIARGGMGIVLQAWDRDLRRRVAMKILQPRASRGDAQRDPHQMRQMLSRFLVEAQITSQLDHPGIVPIYDFGVGPTKAVFYTMPLIRGFDLSKVIQLAHQGKSGWNLRRALTALLKVCDAMAYAHDRGVLHMDLKPSNVRIARFGAVYVMDWGLARLVSREDSHAGTGSRVFLNKSGFEHLKSLEFDSGNLVGTLPYMSPEQLHGFTDEIGPRSDIYSVGAMLYQLLTGHMPYVPPGQKASNLEVHDRALAGPPPPESEVAPDTPVELASIRRRAMARAPEDRWSSMDELAEALREQLECRRNEAPRGPLARLSTLLRRGARAAPASESLHEKLLTERERMRGTRATLELIVGAARIGTWDWLIRENELVWNKEMLAMWGYEPDEFPRTYSGFLDRLAAEDRARVDAIVRKCLRTGDPFSTLYTVVRPDGARQAIDARGSVVFDADGTAQRLVGVCIPVDEERSPEVGVRRDGVTDRP